MIGKPDSDLEVTGVETDIDCVFCLEDVPVALAAVPAGHVSPHQPDGERR